MIDYLLMYSFKLKSAFGSGQLFGLLWLNDTFYSNAKVSEEANRKFPTRNTTVQLLTLYTDPERHNAQRYRQTDGRHYDIKSRSYCVQCDRLKTTNMFSSMATREDGKHKWPFK